MPKLDLIVLPDSLAVCRFIPNTAIPAWAFSSSFFSITKTEDELSIVCNENEVPENIQSERNWRALRVQGTLDFSLTGILASIAEPLAKAKISMFSISTFDTDYVLVKQNDLAQTTLALTAYGHQVQSR